MSSGPLFERFRPDESIPIVRVLRYACYALVIVAGGYLCATLVFGILDVFTGLIYSLFGPFMADSWRELLTLIRDTITGFAVLVAVGVFLTQFEP